MRILIVGAGIAGITAALELHRAGHEVTLMEKGAELRREGYMLDFFGPGFDVAEKIGLLPALAKIHRPFGQLVFVDERGRPRLELAYERLRRQMFRGRQFNVLRGDLERTLFAAVEGRVRTIFRLRPRSSTPRTR